MEHVNIGAQVQEANLAEVVLRARVAALRGDQQARERLAKQPLLRRARLFGADSVVQLTNEKPTQE